MSWCPKTPKSSNCGVRHPNILVYLVICDWLLNCTTSGHFIVLRHSRYRHSGCFLKSSFILGIFFTSECTETVCRLAAGICVPLDIFAGFKSGVPGKGKGREIKEGRKEGREEGRTPPIFER